MSELIGHKRALEMMQKMHANNAFPPSTIISGPTSVGKTTLARTFIQDLLGEDTSAHIANVVSIERLEEKGKRKERISVDQIRKLRTRLSKSSWNDLPTVVLIQEAHTLSTGAQNALLKVLEDGLSMSYILFLTSREEWLLDTIKSRSQRIHLTRVPLEEITSSLINRGVQDAEAEKLAKISLGRPGIAIAQLEDAESHSWQLAEQQFPFKPLPEKLAEIALQKKAPKADYLNRLEQWRIAVHKELLSSLGDTKKRISLGQSLKRIHEAEQGILKNVHPTLALEHAILHI